MLVPASSCMRRLRISLGLKPLDLTSSSKEDESVKRHQEEQAKKAKEEQARQFKARQDECVLASPHNTVQPASLSNSRSSSVDCAEIPTPQTKQRQQPIASFTDLSSRMLSCLCLCAAAGRSANVTRMRF